MREHGTDQPGDRRDEEKRKKKTENKINVKIDGMKHGMKN